MELTQEYVREKLIRKLNEGKQQYIAKQINLPYQALSLFKTGKKQLWDSTLLELNEYLDNH